MAETMPGRPGEGGTLSGATVVDRAPGGDQATVVERIGGTAPGMDQATVVERIGGAGAEATVVEGMGGGAAATVVESKVSQPGMAAQGGGAAATVVERQVPMPGPPAKSKAPLFVAIALVVVIGIVAGVVMLRPKAEPEAGPTTPSVGGTSEGYLLVASPFGETVTVENTADNASVTLSDNVAPLRAALPAGTYRVTLDAGGGEVETHEVTVEAGRDATPIYSRVEVDLDQAVEAVLNP
jgi:hypothetical protein